MAFTMFDKIGDALAGLTEEDRKLVFGALCEYGFYGTMPELPYPLDVVAAAFTEDIDNSREKRASGSRGGRPRKTKQVSHEPEPEVPEDCTDSDDMVSDSEKPVVSDFQKPVVSDSEKPVVSDFQKPVVSENQKPKPDHIQTKDSTDQTNRREKGKREKTANRKRFTPPTIAEVRDYASERGEPGFNVERFCDYYAAQGWRLSNGNQMRDWHAAVRNWIARDGTDSSGRFVKGVDSSQFDELFGEFEGVSGDENGA